MLPGAGMSHNLEAPRPLQASSLINNGAGIGINGEAEPEAESHALIYAWKECETAMKWMVGWMVASAVGIASLATGWVNG